MPPESSSGYFLSADSISTKCERLANALVRFFFGDFFLLQAEGDVVFHGERIEERAFLEDEAEMAAKIEEILL